MKRALAAPLLLLLAGCAEPAAAPEQPAPVAIEPIPHELEMIGCQEAGGVAIYGRDFYEAAGHHVPAPWVLANVGPLLGNPKIGANGDPVLGEAVGHWHMAVVCDYATFDNQTISPFAYGWVGIAVQPPEWDTTPGLHVLLSGLSMPAAAQPFFNVSGLIPSLTEAANISAEQVTYVVHDDAAKGKYETWGQATEVGGDAAPIRSWITLDDNQPLGLQWNRSSSALLVSPDSTGFGCHTETPMHGPQGGLCGLALMAHYQTFNQTLTFASYNLTLPESWHH